MFLELIILTRKIERASKNRLESNLRAIPLATVFDSVEQVGC